MIKNKLKDTNKMKRNPLNTNQLIHCDDQYNGLDLITTRGPLIKNHLARIYELFTRALDFYSRLSLIRFDLYIPENYCKNSLSNNNLISKFIASIKSKIHHSQKRSLAEGHVVHRTFVDYVWCREVGSEGRIHYHFALILNYYAYHSIGKFDLKNKNMYRRIHEAWANALGIYVEDIIGYIHFPKNPIYKIKRGDLNSMKDAFRRVSYFAKIDSKDYRKSFHTFGCSRA